MFKLMNSKELAEFIMSKGIDEEYSFADNFDDNDYPRDKEFKEDENFCSWYGIKRINLFDNNCVAVGFYDWGYDIEVYYVDDEEVPLEEKLEDFIGGGLVCVDLEYVLHGQEEMK